MACKISVIAKIRLSVSLDALSRMEWSLVMAQACAGFETINTMAPKSEDGPIRYHSIATVINVPNGITNRNNPPSIESSIRTVSVDMRLNTLLSGLSRRALDDMVVAFLKIMSTKAVRTRIEVRTKYATQSMLTTEIAMPATKSAAARAYPCHNGDGGEVVS